MNVFQIAIACGALVTAWLAWELPNAVKYIAIAAAVAIACNIYYAYDLPYPAAFTLACDAMICLTIHWIATQKWEFAIYGVFLISVAISIAKLVHMLTGFSGLGLSLVADPYGYRLSLELVNWAALLLICGFAILGGAGDRIVHHPWLSHVRWAVDYLYSPRSNPHWRKVRG